MKISDIRKLKQVILPSDIINSKGAHESILKAYQILQKVKYYLNENVPVKIILELVSEMEEKDE